MSSAPTTTPTTTRPSRPAAPGSRPSRRRRARILRALLLGAVALAAIGFVAQALLEWRDGRAWPPPGELVDVGGGRHLHLHVTGVEHAGPTVVLEAGAGGFSPTWAWVQQDLSEHARVVSYDRAGFGWSDPAEGELDAAFWVADLRAALDTRGIDGPFVLVGHSFGGLLMRAFAAHHPDDVVGMVFVDSAHEDLYAQPDTLAGIAQWRRVVRVVQVANRFGVLRVYDPMAAQFIDGLPRDAYDQTLARQRRADYFRTATAEAGAIPSVGAYVATLGDLDDLPTVVLSAEDSPALGAFQPGIAALSSRSRHETIAGSGHVDIITGQAHAAEVSARIAELIEAARP